MRKILALLVRLSFPLLILAAGVGAYLTLSTKAEVVTEREREDRPVRTRVTELYPEDYHVLVPSQGIVRAHNEITLSARVSSQILRISPEFEEGAHFSEGDVLVELEPREYEIAVTVAEARVRSSEAALEIARENHAAGLRLFEREFIGEAELNGYDAERVRSEANLDSARAELEQAKIELARTVIRAPFDGRVRQKSVGVGQSIGSGATLGTIFAADYAEVRLPISARDRRYLQLPETVGAPPLAVELFDAISPDAGTTWSARIVRTEGTLDEGSLEVVAIARIDDPFGIQSGHEPLRIGQPVTGYVRGEVLNDVVAIPRAAVRELNQIALVDKTDLRLHKVTIESIWADEEHVIVPDSGIFEDMYLATTHIVYAPQGAKVEIIPGLEDSAPLPIDDEGTGP